MELSLDERRARRQARREAERIRSVARAADMRAARLAGEDDGRSTASSFADRVLHWIGTSGWYYWHWRDQFYPHDLPSSKWFEHYADNFRTVELNAPFYSWPTPATVKTWLRQAGRRHFVYTVKANELITHQRRFIRTKELIKDFYHIGSMLGPHMGCFLFQLPPSFRYSSAALHRIISQLDPRWKNVVEFRHKSWWNDRVFDAFKERQVIFCSCSGPRLPDQLVRTADDIYIRFHGVSRWYRHDYTKQELAVWTKRIPVNGRCRVWAYFNNDRDCLAIKNARELRRQLLRCKSTR